MLNKKYQIPCQKIISGGQTGIDRGSLDACLANNFPCGGWCPKNRVAEDGRIDSKYPLQETPEKDYIFRTHMNVSVSDGTLIIVNDILEGGTLDTFHFAKKIGKPLLIIDNRNGEIEKKVNEISDWLRRNSITILNIAGPRASQWEDAYFISCIITDALIKEIKNISPI